MDININDFSNILDKTTFYIKGVYISLPILIHVLVNKKFFIHLNLHNLERIRFPPTAAYRYKTAHWKWATNKEVFHEIKKSQDTFGLWFDGACPKNRKYAETSEAREAVKQRVFSKTNLFISLKFY